jgi:hypothetical protein
MTNPLSNPEIVHHISKQLDDLDPDQIRAVLAAWNNVREGDPVGTVRRQAETGAVAHRVDAAGIHLWRVSLPNGEQYNDMQPVLNWPVIVEAVG